MYSLLFFSLSLFSLSAAPFLWVVNNGSSTVSIIDAATNELFREISPMEGQFSACYFLAFSPDGTQAYIGNYGDGSISVFNAEDFSFVENISIPGGGGLYFIAATEDLIYSVNEMSGYLTIINAKTLSIENHIPIILGISSVIQAGDYLFIGDSSVPALDTLTPEGMGLFAIDLANPAQFFAVSPDASMIYIGETADGIEILDPSDADISGSIEIPGSSGIFGIGFTPLGDRAYAASPNTGNVYEIDTASSSLIGGAITGVGSEANTVAVSPNGRFVYVSNATASTVSVISRKTREVIQTISTEEGLFDTPYFIGFSPASARDVTPRSFRRPVNRRTKNSFTQVKIEEKKLSKN